MVSLNDPLIAELKGALGQDADFMTQWALSPILPIIAQRGKERGGNVLGLERVSRTVPFTRMCTDNQSRISGIHRECSSAPRCQCAALMQMTLADLFSRSM